MATITISTFPGTRQYVRPSFTVGYRRSSDDRKALREEFRKNPDAVYKRIAMRVGEEFAEDLMYETWGDGNEV